ncbi:MAG: glycosyltransferase [Phycicoccus sp.]|nr:glycosyltransferase [Phycicoccus sp.]
MEDSIVRSALLSVVAVTFRDLPGIGRTLLSLEASLHLPCPTVEVLVKDGGTPGLRDLIDSRFSWARLIGGADLGVYDAMNTGLAATSGAWVWFLNGGDEAVVSDTGTFVTLLERSTADIVMFDYFRREPSGDRYRSSRAPVYIRHALPTSHQAIVYKGELARNSSYSNEYSISADYEFTARLMNDGAVAEVAHFAIARFFPGGLSTESQWQVASEALRVQNRVLRTSWCLRVLSGGRHYGIAVWRTLSRLTNLVRGRLQ